MIRFSMDVVGTREIDIGFSNLLRKLDDWSALWPLIAAELRRQAVEQFEGEGVGRSGKWKPLKPSYSKYKQSHYGVLPILFIEGTLKRSLTEKGAQGSVEVITRNSLTWGTQVPYAKHHQNPSVEGRPPRRKVVDSSDIQNKNIGVIISKYINTDALKSFGATQRRIPFGSGV